MVTVTSIKDTRIRIRASEELKRVLRLNQLRLCELPRRLAASLKDAGLELPSDVKLIDVEQQDKKTKKYRTQLNIKELHEFINSIEKTESIRPDESQTTEKDFESKSKDKKAKGDTNTDLYLYLDDLYWLQSFLEKVYEEDKDDQVQEIHLHLNDLLESCTLDLPKNGYLERNPELEARCQQLKIQQQNLEYARMTKDVDAAQKNYPEDTFAFQLKAINAQIIAIMQFIFSVIAGFVFGFFGLQLIFGNLDFGFRLLLGVKFALIIALAEIYFLAKKLTEYDDAVDSTTTTTTTTTHLHFD